MPVPQHDKQHCYAVFHNQFDENGYVPSLITRDEAGHSPMLGNGECSSPWYWGKTFEQAEAVCRRVNECMGLSEQDVAEIIASSMKRRPVDIAIDAEKRAAREKEAGLLGGVYRQLHAG